MLKLRELTLISLLLLMVTVGCLSSDQAAIDKAVSPTLTAAQPPTAAAAVTPEAAKEYGASSIEGVDIEARDEFGGTLLHMTAQKNSLDVARQLIDLGALAMLHDQNTAAREFV